LRANKIRWNDAHGPWKTPLDFGGKPDHIMLEVGLGRWLGGVGV